jgi:hypothetical protein
MTRPPVTEFLLARIAEDEANIEGDWAAGDGGLHIISTHMHDRMVAQCAAMRKIVEWSPSAPDAISEWEGALETLSSIYADHPDFKEEWR